MPWDPLEDWLERPHLPVWIVDEEPGAQIMLAMLKRVAVQFCYLGGSTPGEVRTVRPLEVFRVRPEGPIYVRAWCEVQQAERTFRLDRIGLREPNPEELEAGAGFEAIGSTAAKNRAAQD